MTRESARRRYVIVVEGELGSLTSAALPSLSLETRAGRTTITVTVENQRQLHEVFRATASDGLALVSVDLVPEPGGRAPATGHVAPAAVNATDRNARRPAGAR